LRSQSGKGRRRRRRNRRRGEEAEGRMRHNDKEEKGCKGAEDFLTRSGKALRKTLMAIVISA